MSEFELHNAGNTEAQQKQAAAYLFRQVSEGKATTGVLSGLAVAQTGTASSSVTIAAGAGVVQASVLAGASVMVNDTLKTLDVLGPNPMGGLPRNDIVVFDTATASIRSITGTPNASPTDPTVPTSAIPLARLSHAASATTVPTASITDLRSFTRPFMASVPFADYYRGAGGTFAGGSPEKLAFPNKVEASGITYSSGNFTVPESGRYECSFEVMFPGAAGLSVIGAQIWVNGVYKAFVWDAADTTGNWSAFISRKLRLAAGDVVSFYAQHNATGALGTVSDAAATWCQIELVGA